MPDTKHNLYLLLASSGIDFKHSEQKLLDNSEAKVSVDCFCSHYNIDLPEGFEEAEVPAELFSVVKGRIDSMQNLLTGRKDRFYRGLDTEFLKDNQKDIACLFQELLSDIYTGESYVAEITMKQYLSLEIIEPPSAYELEIKEAERKYQRARKIIWGSAAALIAGLITYWAACEEHKSPEKPRSALEVMVE